MGFDHFDVEISATSKLGDFESIEKMITKNSDIFIKEYQLKNNKSYQFQNYKVKVVIKSNYESQTNIYYSNHQRLIKALEEQDGSNIS